MTTSSFGSAPQLVSKLGLTCPNLVDEAKEYTVASPPAEIALHYLRLMSLGLSATSGRAITETDPRLAKLQLDDAEEQTFMEDMLGKTLDEMLRDGVELPLIQHASQTVLLWLWQGIDTARKYWHGEPLGKALAPRGPRDHQVKASPRKRTR